VETHRVNFAHLDTSVQAEGLASLSAYMVEVEALEPGPIFLCDTEIAQLQVYGTSWRRQGNRLILRNFSHASKVIVVPGSALNRTLPAIFRLGGGEVREFSYTLER
jgi:hypothetical protein